MKSLMLMLCLIMSIACTKSQLKKVVPIVTDNGPQVTVVKVDSPSILNVTQITYNGVVLSSASITQGQMFRSSLSAPNDTLVVYFTGGYPAASEVITDSTGFGGIPYNLTFIDKNQMKLSVVAPNYNFTVYLK